MNLATTSHLADLQQTSNNIVGAALVLWGLGLFIFLIVISVRVAMAVSEAKKQSQLLDSIQKQLKQQGAQSETSNNLTRQLLRAYGHEPDA